MIGPICSLHPSFHRSLPSVDPQVRLDYVFASPSLKDALHKCRVSSDLTELPREAGERAQVAVAFTFA